MSHSLVSCKYLSSCVWCAGSMSTWGAWRRDAATILVVTHWAAVLIPSRSCRLHSLLSLRLTPSLTWDCVSFRYITYHIVLHVVITRCCTCYVLFGLWHVVLAACKRDVLTCVCRVRQEADGESRHQRNCRHQGSLPRLLHNARWVGQYATVKRYTIKVSVINYCAFNVTHTTWVLVSESINKLF